MLQATADPQEVARTKALNRLREAIRAKFNEPVMTEAVIRATTMGTLGANVPTNVSNLPNIQNLNRFYLAAAIYLVNKSVQTGSDIPFALTDSTNIINFFQNPAFDPILKDILKRIRATNDTTNDYYIAQKATLLDYVFLVLPNERDLPYPIVQLT